MTFDFNACVAWIHNHLFLFDGDEIAFLESLIEWARKEHDEEIVAGTRVQKFREIVMVLCRGKEGWPYVRGEEE
jgi:hypothetical protein